MIEKNTETTMIEKTYPLSTLELIDIGEQVGVIDEQEEQVEIEKKKVAAEFASKLIGLKAQRKKLSFILRTKEEVREIECDWELNYETGEVSYYSVESGEHVSSRPMSNEERQMKLFEEEAGGPQEVSATESRNMSGKSLEEMYKAAVPLVREAGKVSLSMIQKELTVGFNFASDIIDLMEKRGVIKTDEVSKMKVIIHEQSPSDSTYPEIDALEGMSFLLLKSKAKELGFNDYGQMNIEELREYISASIQVSKMEEPVAAA